MHKKILFYDDAPVFGGHEVMALQYIDSIAADKNYEVHVSYFVGNEKLSMELGKLKRFNLLHCHPDKIVSGSSQGIRTLLAPHKILTVYKIIKRINPDVVVVLQGNIEICSIAMVAARLAKVVLISYIPLAHSMKVFGAKLWHLRDLLYRWYYHLPNRFIAISQDQKKKISAHGVPAANISVVNNFITKEPKQLIDKEAARRLLDLPAEKTLIGLVGRIDFKHKRQDFLLRTVAVNRSLLHGLHFTIIGCGPDEQQLEKLVQDYSLSSIVSVIPWHNDTTVVYSALDAVLIPSAFEGVPLVMLEAIHYGLPVIASNLDGMAEFLPQEWLFEPDDPKRMVDIIHNLNTCDSMVASVQARFRVCFDSTNSLQNFVGAIEESLCQPCGKLS